MNLAGGVFLGGVPFSDTFASTITTNFVGATIRHFNTIPQGRANLFL